jgi:hypothetical protein
VGSLDDRIPSRERAYRDTPPRATDRASIGSAALRGGDAASNAAGLSRRSIAGKRLSFGDLDDRAGAAFGAVISDAFAARAET